MRLSLRGTYRPQSGRASFVVKSHEILEEEEGDTVHTEGIVPGVSGQRAGLGAAAARPAARRAAGHAPSAGPAAGRRCARSESLPARADAVLAVHLPRDLDEATVARQRLVLEELLLMQVGLLLHKARAAGARVRRPPSRRPAS